ncbi:hypothetical protein PGSY75_0711300 [Plasmodium gaboni]|uniref:Uncharacterized protein n=1 Tax=Plasmodium gaboni TaxID=647221 RepID=A0A151LQ19_9APIC|nr:hypothetical protein PGSY75_0711300 [Plasmodium gaboni]KYO01272.1 hypothetical protein PGSY75_0711300 [Plasmodium gaboni]SOV12858.1 conserved Plasmodium protein, unknown function [Plasmodium gaboni]
MSYNNKFNDKKRFLSTSYQDVNNYVNAQNTQAVTNQPYFYPIIPQYPFATTAYNPNINYPNMIPMNNNYNNYNNKRLNKKKKSFHNFNKYTMEVNSNIREAVNDPWTHLYGKYPNIQFK